jgi:hypothetical protein
MIYDQASNYEYFEYPEYGGLPTDFGTALSPYFVVAVREHYSKPIAMDRKTWVKTVLARMNYLGDKASYYKNLVIPKPLKRVGTLKHCTDCGHMFGTGDACPTCGGTNVRPNVGEGTQIVMTVY